MKKLLHKTFVYFTAISIMDINIVSGEVELKMVKVFVTTGSASDYGAILSKKREFRTPFSIYPGEVFSSELDSLFLEICSN